MKSIKRGDKVIYKQYQKLCKVIDRGLKYITIECVLTGKRYGVRQKQLLI